MLEFKQILKKILLKDSSRPAFWLMLGLIFKGIFFLAVILNHPYHDIPGIWGATQGDDSSYLLPIDNLLQHGAYFPDFRMPGYGAVYLLFRLIFSQPEGCNALIILQLILASVSVYYLALTAKYILKKDSAFYYTFYLFLLCSFPNFFDAYIGSESLCTSLLIFSVYFFNRYFQEQKNKYLFHAGCLVTTVMFIRPVFAGVLVISVFLILFQKNTGLKAKLKSIFLFLVIFLLCEGSWIYRNYQTHKQFITFTTSGEFYPEQATSYLKPLFEFTQSWGGVCSYRNIPSDLDWFQYHYKGMTPITHFDSLPDDIYTSAYNKDSLLRLKKMILALQNPSIDTASASAYQYELITKLNKYGLAFKREKPLVYFVIAPLKMMGTMLYSYLTRNYLDRGRSVPVFGKLIIAFNYLIYWIIILTGLPGIIVLTISGLKRLSIFLVVPFIPLYIILVHPVIFRFFDTRFLMPAFPFIIICSAYILVQLGERILHPHTRLQ